MRQLMIAVAMQVAKSLLRTISFDDQQLGKRSGIGDAAHTDQAFDHSGFGTRTQPLQRGHQSWR